MDRAEGEALDWWFAAATEAGRRLAFALPRPVPGRKGVGGPGPPWAPCGAGDGGMDAIDRLALYSLCSQRVTAEDLGDSTAFGIWDLKVLAG